MNKIWADFLCGALAVALFPVCAEAQSGDQALGQASAQLVRMISAEPQAELAFGAIVADQFNGGAVEVSAAGGSTSYTGSVRPACGDTSECSPHPAHFTVAGEPGHGYTITLPITVNATGIRSGQSLEVKGLASSSASRPDQEGSGQLDGAGSDEFYVGGDLTVPPGSPADFYSAHLPVLVAYE